MIGDLVYDEYGYKPHWVGHLLQFIKKCYLHEDTFNHSLNMMTMLKSTLFSFLVLLLFTFSLQAQDETDQGSRSWLFTTNTTIFNTVSGLPLTTGFYVVNPEEGDKSYLLSLNGTGLYKLSSGFFAGLQLGVSRDWDERSNTTSLLVGPVLRYYLPVSKVKLFVGGQLGYGTSKTNIESLGGDQDFSSNALTYGFFAGYAYPLSSRVDLEGQLTYDKYSEDFDDDDEFKFGITSMRIGLSIKL